MIKFTQFNLVFIFLYFSSIAQTPADCSLNLRYPIFTQIGVQNNVSYAKYPFPIECKDVIYKKDADGACSLYNACLNTSASLIYNVYYPIHNNLDPKLPAVIIFHGGGFAECPDLNQQFITKICSSFAERGFVTFNVEYRRGRLKDNRNDLYASAQHELAIYRALQDCRGAIRSIIKRQNLHSSNFSNDPYEIDVDNIFIGGVSAGGLMSVMAAWYTNPMIYQAFPTPSGSRYNTIQDALGSIDPDYYFGEPTMSYKPHVKGIVSMWGAVPIPYIWHQNNDEDGFFTQTNFAATLKPVISFHGKLDHIFPYDTETNPNAQDIIFSPPPFGTEPNYNSQGGCLINSPFTLDGDDETVELLSASSLNIYNIAKTINPNLLMELYVDCDMSHGLDKVDGSNFKSDFGTGYTTADEVTVYIVQRSSIFFQAILNNLTVGQIGSTSKFTECVNFRNKCASYNGNCTNNDDCPNN